MKKFLSLLVAAGLAMAVTAVEAATPKAAEDPTATVISVGTPAPRVHQAPTSAKKTGKKAGKARGASQGKKVQKRSRTHRK